MKKSRRVSTALLIKSPICSSMYLPILVSRTTYYVGYTRNPLTLFPFTVFVNSLKAFFHIFDTNGQWKLTDIFLCQKNYLLNQSNDEVMI